MQQSIKKDIHGKHWTRIVRQFMCNLINSIEFFEGVKPNKSLKISYGDIDLFYHYCNQMIKYRNAPKSIFNLFSKPNPPVQPDNCPDISNLSDDDIKEKYEISGNYDYKDYIDFANNYHTLKQLNMSKPNMSIKTIKTLGPYQTTAQRLKDEKEMLLVNLTEIRSFSPPSKRKQASIIARLKEIQE
jgi:hypothetical protein